MSRLICACIGFVVFCTIANSSRALADEPVRRAFLVGIERYSDGGIQPLIRAVGDARDIAADLEQVGFEKKNITLATDIRSKDDFNKRFDAFLKTVKEGDLVFFYFAGHGIGIEATNTNFLLFGDLRSPFTYTKEQVPAVNRRDNNIVKLQIPNYLDAYERDEIPKAGVTVKEVEQKIADRKPKSAFVILDACRSILRSELGDAQKAKRDKNSGSRLIPEEDLPSGFLVLYSASFGEQAYEKLYALDQRRNSLFAEVLRSEMPRPGQSLVALADRVSLAVQKIASQTGQQQEPERYPKDGGPDDVYLVGSIGAERFEISQEKCEGAQADWEQVSQPPQQRDSIERHIRRFNDCPTAEQARRLLVNFAENSEDPGAQPTISSTRPIDACDRLAAAETDRARPPDVPGVPFEKISPDEAIAACKDSIARNPRVVRFLFNLGRAHMAQANLFRADDPARQEAYSLARLALDDAEQRGYVAALNNLAVLYDNGLGVEQDQDRANELFKRAAQQGFPLAMYNLALRFQSGDKGIPRDDVQAYDWFAKSADAGLTSALVDTGRALWRGRGVESNPRRAVEKLQQAAELGSNRAKYWLGRFYSRGRFIIDGSGQPLPSSVNRDLSLALLWFGRAAEAGDPAAQQELAAIMDRGDGLPNPQPEIAERYWRLAAYGGNEEAEISFADRLRVHRVLVRPENDSAEAIKLLQRALSQGSVRAAWQLAKIYRNGDLDQPKDPILAMKYAYLAIKLATETDPTSDDGNPVNEFAAGILLAEMARSGEATALDGRPLLTKDEIDRLEKFYGKVDPVTKQVKVRRLTVALDCRFYTRARPVWVWDWGRNESPTEPQFRSFERQQLACSKNAELRDTLSASFATSRKNNVAFADLIDQQINAAQSASKAEADREAQRQRRRH